MLSGESAAGVSCLYCLEARVTTHLILEAKKRPIRRIGCFCLKGRPPPQGPAWFDFLPLRFPVKSQAHAWIRFCASFPLRTTSSCFRWSSLLLYSHLFCATPALPLWLFDLPCMPLPALSPLFGQNHRTLGVTSCRQNSGKLLKLVR